MVPDHFAGRVHASEPARRERPPVPPHLWRTQVRHPRGQICSGCTPAIDAGACRRSRSLQEYGDAAYEQLLAEGYVVSRDRSTTLVAGVVLSRPPAALPNLPATARARVSGYAQRLTQNPAMPPSASYASRPGLRYDFRYGRPAVDEFPREIWRQLLAARARRTSLDAFGYGPPSGYR